MKRYKKMSEVLSNATVFLVAILLVFSWAMPVQANGPIGSNQPLQDEPPPSPTVEAAGEETLQAPANELTAAPTITIWYENDLRFGQIGNPQTQINILGNVSDPDSGGSVTSLSYRLNNGPSNPLTIGPNSDRLANRGDFNVAINTSALANGANTVIITAVDNTGASRSKTVTFNYTRGRTWPQSYNTYWGNGAINDQAQVVDGLWQVTPQGVRPQQVGYDRLIAIGDVGWRNYEVVVPITVHQFYPNGSDAGGVGIIARWQGHLGSSQPPSNWYQIGAYAYYSNRIERLTLRLNETSPTNTQTYPFELNTTYIFKLRAETVGSAGRYSFKIWEQGQPEPAWSDSRFSSLVNVLDNNNDLLSGSVLLVAHRVDATFGNVAICPIDASYPQVNVNVNGGGAVSISPNKGSYQCGEDVVLTATPADGWTFSGWTGDAVSNSTTITVKMPSEAITANFHQAVDQNYKVYLPMITR